MNKVDIPKGPEQITTDWLQRALILGGASETPTIDGIALEPMGEGAHLMSEIVRCRLTYQGAAPQAPASVIIKLPSADPKSLRMNRQQSLYRREYAYYTRIARSAPIRTPAMLYGDFEESSQRFVLVLEDLGDMTAADQVQGVTAAQARSAIRAVASLHGHYWNKLDNLPVSGLHDYTRPGSGLLFQMAYLAYLPPALKNFGHHFPQPMRRLAEMLGPRVADYVADVSTGPRTFTHGDFRAANMFFGADTGDGPEFAVVDWQVCGIASGLFDVAYFLGGSVSTEVRRQIEREALLEYHDTLRSMGVHDFSSELCWRLYRQHMLGRLLITVFVGGGLNLANERVRLMFETSTRRTMAAIEDLDADEFLPARRPIFSGANIFSTLSGGAYAAYRLVRR